VDGVGYGRFFPDSRKTKEKKEGGSGKYRQADGKPGLENVCF